MYILLIGLNHKTAPVEVREQLAFNGPGAAKAMEAFKRQYPGCEFVMLSTCNRVELYIAVDKSCGIKPEKFARFLAQTRDIEFDKLRRHLYIKRGKRAVSHLMTVTSSLDSMVIGDNQISSQVRESYSLACSVKCTGKVLNHLFHKVFTVSKKVFTNTSISSRRISVAGVAVDLAKQLFEDISSSKIVVVGAGEMGELLVEHFLHIKCDDITVVNRTAHRGCSIAKRHGVKSAKWDKLYDQLAGANIVVGAATPDSNYLFEKKDFAAISKKRRRKTLLAIDITVPRSFDPKINELQDVYLYCIDDLSQVVEKNIKLREGDLESAIEIICEGANEYMDWFAKREIGPLIGKMKAAFENIQQAEMKRYFATEVEYAFDKEGVDVAVNRIVNKLLHCVIQNIDSIAKEQGPSAAVRHAEHILLHAEKTVSKKQ